VLRGPHIARCGAFLFFILTIRTMEEWLRPMKKGPTDNACNGYFGLNFQQTRRPNDGFYELTCHFGSSSHHSWRRDGLCPVGLILNRCGIMERVGHQVRTMRLKCCWLSEQQKNRLFLGFEQLFGRSVLLVEHKETVDSDRTEEFENQGLFSELLPSFP
jgi:hypothetical protein